MAFTETQSPNNGLQRTARCSRAAAEAGSFGAVALRRTSRIAWAVVVITWLWPSFVSACSSVAFPPLGVPPNTTAFLGRVTGYPRASGRILGADNVVGLSLTVLEPLLSTRAGSSFDVYLFGSAPDCSPLPRSERDLAEQYPVGSTVTAILKPQEGVPLTTSADGWGHVARVPEPQPRTPDGLLDFKAFRGTYENQSESTFSFGVAWRNAHRGWFEDFEYLRAMIKLNSARRPTEKAAILEDVASYSRLSDELFRLLVEKSHLPAALSQSVVRSKVERSNQR